MHEPMTLEEAATTLNRSVRTVQRMVASGKLRAEERDGRTMVLVERPSGTAIAALQEHAHASERAAAVTAISGERAALAYQELATQLEHRVEEHRRAVRGWRIAAAACGAVAVASLVTLSWVASSGTMTRDMLSDTRARLDRAETARAGLERELAGVTRGDMLARFDAPWSILRD